MLGGGHKHGSASPSTWFMVSIGVGEPRLPLISWSGWWANKMHGMRSKSALPSDFLQLLPLVTPTKDPKAHS